MIDYFRFAYALQLFYKIYKVFLSVLMMWIPTSTTFDCCYR
jgi:hypothetical protein